MPEASKDNYVVGIDLGGTKILAGLFDGSLECIGTAKVSTKAQRGMETVISRIERCVRDAVDEAVVHNGVEYVFVDTAGIRRKGKTHLMAEKLAVVMARRHLRMANV